MPLTVKHRSKTGAERLYTTRDVEMHPTSEARVIRFINDVTGREVCLDSGDCFVMNEQGATIATYIRLDQPGKKVASTP
jgi:hypothetical protein